MSRRLLLVAALVVAPSVAFAGPSRAWTAARKVHQNAPIIAGIDVASAKSSEAFKTFFPVLLKQQPKAQTVLDDLKKHCDFDPFVAINSVVAVIDDSGGGNAGAFYIALNKGWDVTTVGECAQKMAKSIKGEVKMGAIKKGVQEIEFVGGTDKAYLGWIGKDVLVFSSDPGNKTFVEKMVSGKGGGAAAKLAAKLDTSATVWMAVIKEQSLPENMKMKAMAGTVKIAGGNVAMDLKMGMGDKKQAATFVTMANKELPALTPNLPPAAQTLIKTLKLKSAGADVQATATGTEQDVISLVQMALAFL